MSVGLSVCSVGPRMSEWVIDRVLSWKLRVQFLIKKWKFVGVLIAVGNVVI